VTFGLSVALQNALLEGFSATASACHRRNFHRFDRPWGGHLGVMPLLTFGSAVAVIVGLNQLFYRTELGRAFRATSDDPTTASLMGIRPGNIFAKATGIAMLIVTMAALYLGMRSNFDPSIGPARLIYAFEAVIIGGLGSFGARWRAASSSAGADHWGGDQSRMADPGGHVAFLLVLLVRPRGLFPRAVD
jgi:branched-chain amino acid transport system permease protein